MIQKYQTLINRFVSYLEDNQELGFIRRYLVNQTIQEDEQLKAYIIEMNNIIQRIRKSLEILSNNVHKLELSSNAAFTHIKRKARMLGVTNHELGIIMGDELRITSPKEILAVVNRLSKLLKLSKKRQNKTPEQMMVEEDANTLVQMILGAYQEVYTIEGEIVQIMEKENVKRPYKKAAKENEKQQSANC